MGAGRRNRSERTIRTDWGELPESSLMNKADIPKSICNVCYKSYFEAIRDGYRLVQLCFAMIEADRRILSKDFSFREVSDWNTVKRLIEEYFDTLNTNWGPIVIVKYYVVAEKWKSYDSPFKAPDSKSCKYFS